MSEGILIVSHSVNIARGLLELGLEMNPGARVEIAAGDDDGGLGTSYDLIEQCLAKLLQDVTHVTVFADLGSAKMTTEQVIDFEYFEEAARITLSTAPFLEGFIEHITGLTEPAQPGPEPTQPESTQPSGMTEQAPTQPPEMGAETADVLAEADTAVRLELQVRNSLGLHARPAAQIVQIVKTSGCEVLANGVNAGSVLELMQLSVSQHDTVTFEIHGEHSAQLAQQLTTIFADGFGEE